MNPAATTWSAFVAVFSETDARVIIALFVAVPATLSAISMIYARKANQKLSKNGGSTPADAINRIEHAVTDLATRMVAVEEYITNPKEQK